VRMPRKTLMYVLAAIPLVRRWAVTAARMAAAEEFASGRRALVMPENAARMQQKREMLELFSSEDGQKLVRTFGGRGRFRERSDFDAALRERPWGYVPFEGYRVGISTLVALAIIYGVAFVGMAMLGRMAVRVGLPKGTVAGTGAVLVAAATWICIVKARDPRRRVFLVASVVGFLAGGCFAQSG